MAESFLFSFAQNVLEKLGSLALDEVVLAWGVRSELQRLHNTLSSIQAVLLDAEEQQAKNHQLEDWLEKLKDVLYEIDEVLDEFEIKALQQKVDGGSIISKVPYFFPLSYPFVFNYNVGHKIKEIKERLDQIADDRCIFHLSERREDRPIVYEEREMTNSFVHTSDVIGRVEDKENIVKLLMCPVDSETLSVIPIVGIGGLGKTTLAKMVFSDEWVAENFELRMWVCVLEEFELEKLVKKIITSTTGEGCGNLDLEQLQIRLRNILDSKKYLLILDDVRNLEVIKWRELRDILRGGSHESKIIVTTRVQVVASIMGIIEPYNLGGLSHEECLSLFVKWAFKEGQEIESQRRLMKIGEEIVRKCKGVPLAVRTLGSMLYMKSDEREWVYIRDNEIWELEQKEGDILPVLRLSYDQLPSYLKPCFAYCSTYAKDATINSIDLISLWMAQGLIRSPNQNKEVELEDVGLKYIHELCSKSLLQDVQDYGWCVWLKMHDLVHDLALWIAKSEYATISTNINHDDEPIGKTIMAVSRRVRHVSFSNYNDNSSLSDVPSCLLELNNLRSIRFQFEGMTATSKSFVEACTFRFKYLRLLDLHNSCFETLPSSIGNLKHLRYLSLQHNRSIKSLPNSICELVCLQTLLLHGCERLEMLPIDVGKLISLRYLSLTTQGRCLSVKRIFGSNDNYMTSLRYFRISKCSNLESLFDDEDDDVENKKRHTSVLRTLLIKECASLLSLPRGLRYLTSLENLLIQDCENLDLIFDTHAVEDVVRTGSGLKSLQRLWFMKLPKLVTLPRWILQGSVCNTLKHITIVNCLKFTTLPDWMTVNLKSLQKLWIYKCPQLRSLPKGMHRLTTLSEIRILSCPELMSRCQRETGEDWHEIAHVPHIYLNGIKI